MMSAKHSLGTDGLIRFRNDGALKNIIMHPGDSYNITYHGARGVQCTLLDARYIRFQVSKTLGGVAVFELRNQTERCIVLERIQTLTRSRFRPTTEEEREAILNKHRAIMEERRASRPAIVIESDPEGEEPHD